MLFRSNGGNGIRIPVPAQENNSGVLWQRVKKRVQYLSDFSALEGLFLTDIRDTKFNFLCDCDDLRLALGCLMPIQKIQRQVTEKDPQFVRDYYSYYQTERGHHERSFGSTTGATLSSVLNFTNAPINMFIDEIEAPVLLIHGEKAHSRYFSEAAYKKLKGENKELFIVPGAVHTDLYDKMDVIPFDKIEDFFKKSLR